MTKDFKGLSVNINADVIYQQKSFGRRVLIDFENRWRFAKASRQDNHQGHVRETIIQHRPEK